MPLQKHPFANNLVWTAWWFRVVSIYTLHEPGESQNHQSKPPFFRGSYLNQSGQGAPFEDHGSLPNPNPSVQLPVSLEAPCKEELKEPKTARTFEKGLSHPQKGCPQKAHPYGCARFFLSANTFCFFLVFMEKPPGKPLRHWPSGVVGAAASPPAGPPRLARCRR